MLAEEVHLRDWIISVFGKAEAIRETVKNFAEAESIEIHILALYESTDTVAGELHIGVDGKIDLYLVDAVTFNAQGKVTPVINRTYTLENTAEAVRHVGAGHAAGKVIIRIKETL